MRTNLKIFCRKPRKFFVLINYKRKKFLRTFALPACLFFILQFVSGRMQKWAIIVGVLAAVTLLLIVALITILLWRKITEKSSKEDPKGTTKSLSSNRAYSFQSQRAASKSNVPRYVMKLVFTSS